MDNNEGNKRSSHNYTMTIGKVRTVSSKQNQDHPNTPCQPCARSGHAAVATDKNFYIYGGYNPSSEAARTTGRPLFQELWQFNFDEQRWKKLDNRGTIPELLASMSMVLCGDVIVLYGGTGFPFGFQMNSSLYCFSIREGFWRQMSGSKEVPDTTYGQSISVSGSSLYVFGGTSGWDYNANVHRCDLRTVMWERCFDFEKHYTMLIDRQLDDAHVPLPRYRHEMVSDGENLYVLGGGTSYHAFSLDSIHVFNTRTHTWSKKDTRPDPGHGFPGNRRCHGCCQLGNEGYISGGFNGKTIYDDIWRLTVDSLQWVKLEAKLPQPVYFHSSAITPEGCIYYHGGVLTRDGNVRTDKLNFVWVKVPSLLTMSWRCILKQNPSIRELTDTALRSLGIPEHIIRR